MNTLSHNSIRYRGARRRGITLIEVLATMLLIAIVTPAMMKGLSLATATGSAARRRNEASSLAASKLAELIATNQWQTTGLGGDIVLNWPDEHTYHWTAQVQDWIETNVSQVDLQLTWNTGTGEQSLTLSTLAYNTTSGTSAGSSGSSGGSSGSSGAGGKSSGAGGRSSGTGGGKSGGGTR